MKPLNPLFISGKEVLPLVEGGKGISVSNGESSGAWAASGGVGTFSAVNPAALDKDGNIIPIVYKGRTPRVTHNSDDPLKPEDPLPRVQALREVMNCYGLHTTTIIMAGGVWYLRDWEEWIDNPQLGPIAFQYGTRPLLTKESPISEEWKTRLSQLKEGDIYLNKFSPTGFYSSAVRNEFLGELHERSDRQVAFQTQPIGDHDTSFPVGPRKRLVYLTRHDHARVQQWVSQGFTEAMRTPDTTLIFVRPDKALEIHTDQIECMGCLSACKFSNWSQGETGTTGKKADPRSFCIQKTLQSISHGSSIDNQLMFSGHTAFKFGQDPFYKDSFVPTVKQLVERLQTGN